jgi:hypothetical protein
MPVAFLRVSQKCASGHVACPVDELPGSRKELVRVEAVPLGDHDEAFSEPLICQHAAEIKEYRPDHLFFVKGTWLSTCACVPATEPLPARSVRNGQK